MSYQLLLAEAGQSSVVRTAIPEAQIGPLWE